MPLASPMPPRSIQDANRNIACASQGAPHGRWTAMTLAIPIKSHPYKDVIEILAYGLQRPRRCGRR